MAYWVDVYSPQTWQESLENGGRTLTGFTENLSATVGKLKAGDTLLCYVTGISRLIAVKRVAGPAFREETPLFGRYAAPLRVPVETELMLSFETAVPIVSIGGLSILGKKKWNFAIQKGLNAWSDADGALAHAALRAAFAKPVAVPVRDKALKKRTNFLRSDRLGLVAIPDREEPASPSPPAPLAAVRETAPETQHTDMQALLLEMGAAMGFAVWAPRNDRGRATAGRPLSDTAPLLDRLPLLLDDATLKTAENIDALWIQGKSIYAAFEIERSTSIHSGLLRMSDLQVMQPHLTIPIYIVCPDERFDVVSREIFRPTFCNLGKPLKDICKVIRFTRLKDHVSRYREVLKHMNASFLDTVAEPPRAPNEE